MPVAKLFRSGNSNAIRIPAAIDFGDFKEFDITQKENKYILTPIVKTKEEKWKELFDFLKATRTDSLQRPKVKAQKRDFGDVFA